jgi:hypothetical protein
LHFVSEQGLIKAVGQIAQSVEQWTENPRVGSSNLPLATTVKKNTISHSHRIKNHLIEHSLLSQHHHSLSKNTAFSVTKHLFRKIL